MPKKTFTTLHNQIVNLKNQNKNAETKGSGSLPRGISSQDVSTKNDNAAIKYFSDLVATIAGNKPLHGLFVEADDPPSEFIFVRKNQDDKNQGVANGLLHNIIEDDKKITVPLGAPGELYLTLFNGVLSFEDSVNVDKVVIAKIIIPSENTEAIQDDQDNEGLNGHIVDARELFFNNRSIVSDYTTNTIRNIVEDLLASNLQGTINLTEQLKITSAQNSMELNSEEIIIKYNGGTTAARFNQHGLFFFDENGAETARFTEDDARIGNIRIIPNAIESFNYMEGVAGFHINSDGNAEFNNVIVRGTLNADDIIAGTVTVTRLSFAGVAFVSTLEFNALGIDEITWTSGSLVYSNGTSVAIAQGTTGSMSVVTYIYYNGTGTLQTTTDINDVSGEGVSLIATATPSFPSEMDADSNTMLLFHLNTGSGLSVTDSSGQANHGTITEFGSPPSPWTSGKFSYGFHNLWKDIFPGDQNFIVIANDSTLDPGTGDYTWEFWIKDYRDDPISGSSMIMRKGAPFAFYEGWSIELYEAGHAKAGQLRFRMGDKVTADIDMDSEGTVANNDWTYVAIVRDTSDDRIYISIDGVLDTIGAPGSGLTGKDISRASVMKVILEVQTFSGAVDEIRLSDKARTTTEIGISAGGSNAVASGANVNSEANSYIKQDGSRGFTSDQSMGNNRLTNVGTPVSITDAANKAYAKSKSFTVPFSREGGGGTVSLYGILVDAGGEYAATSFILPEDCTSISMIRITAHATGNAGAGNKMVIETNFSSGKSDEAYNTNTSNFTEKDSLETDYSADDIVTWEFTVDPGADTFFANSTGGDTVVIQVLHETSGTEDATDADIIAIEVEYS